MATQERLQYLVSKYGDELDECWKKYVKACKADGKTPKDFLHDISLYKGEQSLGVGTITSKIYDEITQLPTFREKQKAKRAAKRQKREQEYQSSHGKVCTKCGEKKFLGIFSKACDGNSYTLPNGRERGGYLPEIPSICTGDGAMFDVCINCGFLYGFDRNVVQAAIAQQEQEEETEQDDAEEFDDDEDEDEEEEEDNSNNNNNNN